MKALVIKDSFGLDNLALVEQPRPEPGPGQVLLRMKAASLNYRDLMTVSGAYNPRQPLPLIPCSDGVGEVIELGEGVDRVEQGQRVASIFCQGWHGGAPDARKLRSTLGGPLQGTLAEYVCLSQEGVVAVPDYLSDEEAATLPCAGVTAWTALVTEGGVTAGDQVLVQGTGGVSIFALQIARMLGATVIATSSSDEKLARAIELGAAHGINYKETPKWGKKARALSGGGVDHVVEVGGAGTLAQSLAAVGVGGTISVIGVLSGVAAEVSVIPMLMSFVRIQGILVGHRESFEALCRAMAAASMRPVIDSTYPLEQTRAALEHMAAGKHLGKICIKIS